MILILITSYKYSRRYVFSYSLLTDVNECEEGLAKCHPNSDCINIPGQYYCKCKKGYHSDHYDNLNGLLCRGECSLFWGRYDGQGSIDDIKFEHRANTV